MYSTSRLAAKWLRYYFTASNGGGHGIHSPFVFEFVTRILNDHNKYEAYDFIEKRRKNLLQDKRMLNVEDFGAGSSQLKSSQRKVSDIASVSLKPAKFGQLLFRNAQFYKPSVIVELGTSLGITSSYLASGNTNGKTYTFEGSDAIAAVAREQFESLELKNIELIEGNFDNTLAPVIENLNSIDFAFIDGNHRREAVLRYFDSIIKKSNPKTIIAVDDIHWSVDMEDAWKEIKESPMVKLSIDLFFTGFVFMREDFKVKQHFVIRF